ncbi:immunoglobulin-like domain-containing protein [Faecalibacillus faecis]|uniref:immunoglobulin-like domain-containing protein n=1 Tax=Faecalibacillus faecis TaxID=1982628 RepID=UPI00386B19C8
MKSEHDYEYYSRIAFDPKQLQIIKDGLDLDLDVDWYANTAFDYLQMEQIFLALKAGISDPDILNMFCDPKINYQSMEQLRIQTFKKLGIYEKAAEEVKKKRIIRIGITFVVLALIVTIGSLTYINRKTIGYYFENINLELKEEKIKLGMSKPFVASEYIKKYDKEYKLTLPKEKQFDKPGTYTVTYKLSNKVKSISKHLMIDVYDDVSPVIILKETSITVDNGSKLNLKDYIESATDNVDGDLKEKVKYNSIDTNTAGNYTVDYEVDDNAGNHGTCSMSVLVKEKPVQQPAPATSSQSQNTSDNKNSSSANSSSNSSQSSASKPKGNASAYNKFFEGYSIDSYNAACDYADGLKNSGKISGYSVTPTGEGVQVTCY